MKTIKEHILNSYKENPAKWYSGVIIYLLYVIILYIEDGMSVALGLPVAIVVVFLSSSLIYYILSMLFEKKIEIKIILLLFLMWLMYFPIAILLDKVNIIIFVLVFSMFFGSVLAIIEKLFDS